MDKALDMSLDDLIKSKKTAGGGRGRGRGDGAPRGRGAGRRSFGGGRMRGTGRGVNRQVALGVKTPSSFGIAKSVRRTKNFPLQHDLFEESLAAAGLPRMESATKLFISNLDYGVSNSDIRELFTEIGELKRYAIHYDKNGRPSGSAEVVYAKRSDAFAAHKRYNNVQLDGRLMKIEIVSPGSELPVSARVNVVVGTNGKATRTVVMTQRGGRPMLSVPSNRGIGQRRRGGAGLRNSIGGAGLRNTIGGRGHSQSRGGRSGGGRGRGRGHGKKQEKSAEELDKELENYHADVMQIS